MGTELLNNQHSFAYNEQNQKSTQSKQNQMMSRSANDEKNVMLDDEGSNDLELDLKNNEFENNLFSKFDTTVKLDDSSDDENARMKPSSATITKSKSTAQSKPKIVIKKNANLKQEPNQQSMTKLGLFESKATESMMFRDDLREIRDENGRLRKVLAEKDYEISYLKKKIDEENAALGAFGADKAAIKIVEMAKRSRELTAQYEAEHTRNKQLTKTMQELENQLAALKRKLQQQQQQQAKLNANSVKFGNNNDDDDESANDSDDASEPAKKVNLTKENKELREKLQQTSQKMLEFKHQSEILRQELKKTQRALEKEVGENVDVKAILASNASGWRGRQQQIRTLQSKLGELKQQMGLVDARASQIMMDDMLFEGDEAASGATYTLKEGVKSAAQMSTFSGITSHAGSMRSIHDLRQKNDIRRIEKDRKEQNEKIKRDFENMEVEMNATKEKLEASKSRNKVLTNENKTLKEQVRTLLEKGKHDDELVDALLKKQNQMKETIEQLSAEHEKVSRQVEDKSRDAQMKIMQEKNTLEQMKAIISEKEKRIQQLESDLNFIKSEFTSTKSANANNGNERTTDSAFFIHPPQTPQPAPPPPPQPTINHFQQQQQHSEFVKARTGTSSTMSTHAKMDMDRDMSSRASMRNGKTSVAAANRPSSSNGLNARYVEKRRDSQMDFKLENCELKTLYKTSEIERLRLMDLAKNLQRRVEEMSERIVESENKLNEQRRRAAHLDKQLERSKLQQDNNSSSKNGVSAVAKTKANGMSSTIDQYKLEELETSLLIQKDENDALKAALKSTLEAKEEDLRLYTDIIDSAKRMYLDGLKQCKQLTAHEN